MVREHLSICHTAGQCVFLQIQWRIYTRQHVHRMKKRGLGHVRPSVIHYCCALGKQPYRMTHAAQH